MTIPSLRITLPSLLAGLLFAAAPQQDLQSAAPPTLQGVYTIQQKSNGRFLDAHNREERDFAVVTRLSQDNLTQRWILTNVGGNTYTIQQQHNGRFLDAHNSQEKDFRAVTRLSQNNLTQRWILTLVGADTYTIQQQHNGRFLDAHGGQPQDFGVVTRLPQQNDTQRWILRRASTAPPPAPASDDGGL